MAFQDAAGKGNDESFHRRREKICGRAYSVYKSDGQPFLSDRWIIKPLDSYASRGVFAGVDYSEDEWEDIVHQHWNKNYIYQEYYHPYRTENICFRDANPQFQSYTNMSGLYVYNGEFAGVYSRLSTGGIISSQYNERAVATLVVKEENE